jgi:lysophospholipase L1-like esterase
VVVVQTVKGTFKAKHGPKATIPTLDEGVFGVTNDTNEVFVGSASTGNIQIAKQTDLDALQTDVNTKNNARISDISSLQTDVNTKNNARVQDISDTNTRLNTIIGDNGNSNAEIVDARGGFPLLRERLDDVTTSLAERAQQIGVNVLDYGAVADGFTACDTATTNAQTAAKNKKIFFPQNSTNNAVYYFTSKPSLDGYVISSDPGVKLSFPDTNFFSFKNVTFSTDIQIISRDRNNIGIQLKSDISKIIYQSLSDLGDYGVTSYTNVLQSDLTFIRRYTNNTTTADLSTKVFYNGGKIYFDKTQLDFSTNYLNCVELTPTIGTLYTAVFDIETTVTSGYRAGIVIASADNTYTLVSCDSVNKYWIGTCTGTNTWADTNFATTPSGAYTIYNNVSVMFSFRQIDADNVDIFINGMFVTRVNKTAISKIGFCYNSQSNLDLMYIQDIVKSSVKKMSYGNDLNIAVFGDSITYGEGANLSWADFLPQILEGKRGIAQVKITNNAHSGDTSTAQWNVMNPLSLTDYNLVLVMVGTNDIQGSVTLSTYETNLTNMINKIKAAGAIPIFGIPPMFTSTAETGYGYNTSNYNKGAVYRSTVMRVCATNNVIIADVQSDLGRIGADNVQLRDNLHPQTRGQVMISRCFARSILKAITADM